jgi:hypothetical protein
VASVVWAGPVGPAGRSRVLSLLPLEPTSSQQAGQGSSATVSQPSAVYASTAGTTVTVSGLTLGATYRVQVRAYDAAGNASAWSQEIVFTTVGNPAPATVAATTAVPTPSSPASIAPATVAASASIAAPAAGLVRTLSLGNVTSTTVTGLSASSPYKARVRARDAAGNWSAWSSDVSFTTTGSGTVSPATVAGTASFPAASVGGTPPTVTAGSARPVARSGSVLLDVTATPPGGASIIGYSWSIISGSGSLTNSTTATPTYTAPGSGSGLVTIRATVQSSNAGVASADVTVSYAANVVAAENALTGTARATWDLSSPNLGGVSTLQGFADGFTADKNSTINFKIAQSDTAGWTADVYRLGYYGGDGARFYGTLTPSGGQLTASQAQPSPGDADPNTTLPSADCANWSTTLTWTPPSWAPSGIYILRLNRTGGGASHVMFIVRDDARAADVMLMPSDSTWNAYNAWGGMGGSMYSGNSLYFGTAVDQYNADCARFVSYNRPVVNRGAADSGRSYGAVEWSTFFTGEYPMVRFLERNGYDVKYYGCIDAAGDSLGTHLLGNGSTRGAVKTAMMVGHNEYWSDGMRAGWERAKNRGVNIFTCASNEVFWRLVGASADGEGRPRVWECFKSTIAARSSTGRPDWTGTWRDPDGAGKGGNNPENSFTGTIFVVNGPDLRSLVVPFAGGYSAEPLWRHTSVASLTTGQSYTSPGQILGFEWDTYGPAGVSTGAASYIAAPHPRARYCSNASYSISSGLLLTDAGDVYDAAGTAVHRAVVHPGGAGAVCFATGSINWALGLDSANTYQQGSDNTDDVLRQATVNMLMDMGASPATLMSPLTLPTFNDWYPDVPTTTVQATVAIPSPTVIAGGTTATPATVSAAASIGAPTITRGAGAQPATVAAAASVGSPAVRLGVDIAPTTVSGAASVPTATVQTSSGGTATPATVNGSTAVSGGAQTGSAATPPTVTAAAAIPAPAVRLSVVASPATVAAATAVGTAIPSAGSAVTPGTVAGSISIGAPTVASGNSPTPTTVTGSVAVPTPTVRSGSAPAPATVSGSATVPAPSVGSATAAQPSTVTGSVSIGAPAMRIGTAPAPATLAAQAAVAAVTVLTGGQVVAPTVTASVTIAGPAVRLAALPEPATVAAAVSVPATLIRASAAVTVGTINGSVFIGQISHVVGAVVAATGTATVTGDTLRPGVIGDSIAAEVI